MPFSRLRVLGEQGPEAFHSTIRCVQPLIRAAKAKESLHAEVVLNCCVMTCNVVQEIARIDLTPVAYGLCRSVLELAAGTIHLAQHEELLEDFRNYGRWLQFKIAHRSGVCSPADLTAMLPNHAVLEEYFKAKSTKLGNRFPTWHGMNQNKLIGTLEEDQMLKNNASAFVHGDSLATLATESYTPQQQTWQPKQFHPFSVVDARVPILTAISICADLLVGVNEILQLGCTDVVKQLHENMRILDLPGS